jgi:diguanylate cyclase (GGDEF)-like protein
MSDHTQDEAAGASAAAPGLDDLKLMRTVSAVEFAAAAVMLAVAQFQPDLDTSDHVPLLIIAAVNLVLALVITRVPARVWILRGFTMLAILLVSAVMAFATPAGPVPFFYLWPMLTLAYFMRRADVVFGFALFATSLAAVLVLWSHEPNRQILFGGVVLTIGFVMVMVVRLKEHLRTLIGELHRSATTDALTGLVNRRALGVAMDRELERAHRSGLPLTLISFDLDHFKQVNDRFGHAAGDEALKRFAAALRAECSAADVPARVGGEEFAALLFGSSLEAGLRFAERVRARLASEIGLGDLPFTVSAGVATLSDEDETPARMLLAADRALYAAKEAGRDRVHVWTDELYDPSPSAAWAAATRAMGTRYGEQLT